MDPEKQGKYCKSSFTDPFSCSMLEIMILCMTSESEWTSSSMAFQDRFRYTVVPITYSVFKKFLPSLRFQHMSHLEKDLTLIHQAKSRVWKKYVYSTSNHGIFPLKKVLLTTRWRNFPSLRLRAPHWVQLEHETLGVEVCPNVQWRQPKRVERLLFCGLEIHIDILQKRHT